MAHQIPLVSTICVGLTFAFAGGMLARRVKQPPLVGYLVAGIMVGPFTPGFVADIKLAPQLAEIGVMLLMFGVGMHFSVPELLAVRRISIPGAVGQILFATALGFGLGRFWGWSPGGALVLGMALSVASTVVLLRALEARDEVSTPHGRIAVGWLIVEDLVMVLVLILLPAFATPLGGVPPHGHPPPDNLWLAVGTTLGKVVAFVILMLVVVKRILPWSLRQIEANGSRELFTLAVISLALGVAYASAEFFDVSFALGAFFAGMVVNGSEYSHRAAHELQPLQDVFSALFFIAIGMLFDPAILFEQPLRVLAVVALITVGKSLAAFSILRVRGYGMGDATVISASLTQIGEFSFILATLGVEMKLLPAEGQTLIVAGALISITLNPLVFSFADRWRPPAGQPRAPHPALQG